MSDIPPRWEERMTDLLIRLSLLALFIYWSVTLIRPFLPVLVWAIILVVALFPVHVWLSARLGGRRKTAAVILTIVALFVVLGPVAALAQSFVETVHRLTSATETGALHLPAAPSWLIGLPVVGERIGVFWTNASGDLDGVLLRHREMLLPIGSWLIGAISAVSFDVVKFVLSIILAGLLLIPGPRFAQAGERIASRIVAPRGAEFVNMAGATIRNVSRGVLGVALVQSLLIGIALDLAGVPGAGLLVFVILILCILQIGPLPIVLPVLIWMWATMATPPALLWTVILVPLTVMDNFLKPMLMGRGLSTPAPVIFLGVVGGTMTHGLIGLFLGPVVIGVFYDLLTTWAEFDRKPEGDP